MKAGPLSRAGLSKRIAVVLYDVGMAILAYCGAFLLRYNLSAEDKALWPMWQSLPIVLSIQVFCFTLFGLYRGVWRFASTADLLAIVKAVSFGVPIAALGVFFLNRLEGVPRSVFFIDWFVLVVLLGSGRFAYRAWKDRLWIQARGGIPTLIVGSGTAAAQVLRESQSNPQAHARVIGLVDDAGLDAGSTIMGVPFLGRVDDIRDVIARRGVELVLVAVPDIRGREMRRIVSQCERTGVTVKTIPGLSDIVDGRVRLEELREVRPEDLLGREPNTLERGHIAKLVAGRRVLVTGAGGSIGSELCRQLAEFEPSELVAVDQSEYALYHLDLELRERFGGLNLVAWVADVCNSERFAHLLAQKRPDILLHAAAYKHVPMMEHNVGEAVHNNVGGTLTVARAAVAAKVPKFVLISTDKAVNPTNVMGASKRLAEIACQCLQAAQGTQFTVVRFGNVLGSAGSVIERFQAQIKAGGPVTVTHAEITRYFMSIPEAALLVLQAATLGRGGEIYLLDMGEPVRIMDLARQMITLAGKMPGDDIEIKITGLRPGEKLYEELLVNEENSLPTTHPKIFVAASRTAEAATLRPIDELVAESLSLDETILRERLRALVPEYHPAPNGNGDLPEAEPLEAGALHAK